MRAVFAAFGANLGIAAAKFAAFFLTGSASMLAEAVHSVADTGNEALLIIGRGRSNRPRSEEHPFGFGRERYFYGFVVSVMLFTVGATFSVYDGVHKILNPEPVHSPWVDYGVLALSAALEAFSLRTGIREANRVRGGRSWPTFIRRAKAPELPVVLLEDTAALIGLVFAFAGVALSVLTRDGRWDGAGSLGIGALLATAAAILAVETKSLLIGESASAEMQQLILAALEEGPDIIRVIHLRTVHIGPDSLMVAAKVAVQATDTAEQIAAGINAAEERIRVAVPIATTIYLEPDIYRPSLADQTDPSIRAVLRSRDRPENPPPPKTSTAPTVPGAPAGPTVPDAGQPGEPQPPALRPLLKRPYGMVTGMATRKVTVTLDEVQLDQIRALVQAQSTASLSGFVQHAVAVALDDVAGWGAMLADALRQTGGPLSDDERAWADDVLGTSKRPAA
jgi:cation diffusion facilitator family transporter